jgi:hypothetical protein
MTMGSPTIRDPTVYTSPLDLLEDQGTYMDPFNINDLRIKRRKHG